MYIERQAHEGTSQIKKLENALRMCNDEIQIYIDAIEESKELFDREIAQRDGKGRVYCLILLIRKFLQEFYCRE